MFPHTLFHVYYTIFSRIWQVYSRVKYLTLTAFKCYNECMDITDKILMNDGYAIPRLGFGTYLSKSGDECYYAVREALKTGYRHIDTASFYRNEESVGQAIRDSGIPREQVFVTTKLWNDDQGYDNAMRAFEKSFKALNLAYVDLYLIHWPIPYGHENDYRELNLGSWKAFIELREQKLVRSVGVSNFMPEHIEYLTEQSGVKPCVNQIELHPALVQRDTTDYCKANGIVVEAWRPIMRGEAAQYPVLEEIAEKHGVSASQVCIAWSLLSGYVPLPKSVHADRIRENADVFNIALDDEDMARIAAMPEHRYGSHPLKLTAALGAANKK